jgi:hypothetical protein
LCTQRQITSLFTSCELALRQRLLDAVEHGPVGIDQRSRAEGGLAVGMRPHRRFARRCRQLAGQRFGTERRRHAALDRPRGGRPDVAHAVQHELQQVRSDRRPLGA